MLVVVLRYAETRNLAKPNAVRKLLIKHAHKIPFRRAGLQNMSALANASPSIKTCPCL